MKRTLLILAILFLGMGLQVLMFSDLHLDPFYDGNYGPETFCWNPDEIIKGDVLHDTHHINPETGFF